MARHLKLLILSLSIALIFQVEVVQGDWMSTYNPNFWGSLNSVILADYFYQQIFPQSVRFLNAIFAQFTDNKKTYSCRWTIVYRHYVAVSF